MDTQGKPSLHPLYAGAAAAVILACGVATAALMGWLPTSTGEPAEKAVAQKPANTAAQPAPARQVAPPPARPAQARPAGAGPTASAKCAECGVIASVQAVQQQGQGTGVGAVGGAVVGGIVGHELGGGRGKDLMTVVGAVGGGIVGHELGGGRGKDLMTVVGAVGGGLAGNQIEKKVKSTTVYQITVRLEDGTTRVFTEANPPAWRQGDKVKITNGQIQSNA